MIHWVPFASERFHFKEWDDGDTVVYDTISGDTHVVDPLAMELVQLLREHSPRTADQLVAEAQGLYEGASESEVSAAVGDALVRLQQLDLVIGSDR